MRTKEELPECPVATAVSLIGGKWKLLLLRNLKERPWRFNELQRSIDGISQKVLTESLRQMIDDGLAYRRDYHENPPKVEYGLTDLGTEMLPIVNALADFGNYYKSTNPIIWGCISYTLTGITFANLLIFYLLFLAANFLSIKIVSQKAGEYNYLLHRFPGYSAIENTLIYRKFSFIALDAFRSGRSRHPWTL